MDEKEYRHRKTEILILIGVFLFVTFFVLIAYKKIRMGETSSAINYSIVGAIISYIIWWVANYKETKADPIQSMGGDATRPLSN